MLLFIEFDINVKIEQALAKEYSEINILRVHTNHMVVPYAHSQCTPSKASVLANHENMFILQFCRTWPTLTQVITKIF